MNLQAASLRRKIKSAEGERLLGVELMNLLKQFIRETIVKGQSNCFNESSQHQVEDVTDIHHCFI